VVTTEDFISCFGCIPDKTSSSPSFRHLGHYRSCIDSKDELTALLADVHTSIPQSIDIMLENFSGDARINKLRIIKLLKADLNQVLRSAFTIHISKLSQGTPGIVSEH
jgi:hypothetical protein